MIESTIPEDTGAVPSSADDTPGGERPPSFDIPSNKYSDIFGLWPPELFEGFEEFVKESRTESGFGREPPPWW
jgi:hypothetical protein